MKSFLSCAFGVITVSLAGCLPPDPAKTSKAERLCVPEPDEQAMVLATLGDAHLSTPGYALSRVGDAMDAFRPDAVLFDVSPSVLRGAHEIEAPLELAYVVHVASTRGCEVVAVGQMHRPDARAAADYLAATTEATGLVGASPTFDAVHGAEGCGRVADRLNARARSVEGDPGWARDQAWLEHETASAIAARKPKRVLIVTGVLHRAAMESFLRGRKVLVKDPVSVVGTSKVERDPLHAPDAVLAGWQQQLRLVQVELAAPSPAADGAWLAWRAAVLELALRRGGGCCVTDDELPRSKGGSAR